MTQITRKQHTVPRCYLKNFSDDGVKIFGKNKIPDNEPRIPRNYELKKGRSIDSATVVLDHYTLDNHPNPMAVEQDFYANNVENDFSEVYNILTDPTRKFISPLERCKIFLCLLSLHCRTKNNLNY